MDDDDHTVEWLGRTYTREAIRHAFAHGWNPFTGAPAAPGDPRVPEGFTLNGR